MASMKILQVTVLLFFVCLTVFISPVYSCWNCNKFVNKSPGVSMGNATVISSSRNANGCSTQTITCQGTYTSTVSHIGVNYAGESAPTTVSDSSDGGTPQITVVCDRVDSWTYNGKKISDEFECSQSPASTTQPSTTTPKPTIPSTTPVPTTKTTTPASTTQTSTSTPKPTTASTTPVPTTKATTPAPTTTKASTPAPTTTKGTTTPTTSACPPGGKWSDWSNGTSCTDTCGSCGTTTKSRTCESEKNGCPCSGSPTSQESCGNAPCKYPRTSCCSPYKAAAVKSTISCTGSVTTTPAPTTKASSIGPSATTSASSASSSTKSGSSSASSTGTTLSGATCPPGGTWSEWTSPTNCNDTCGNCGYVTITRTCTSEKSGCPCEGSASAEECCNPTPCPAPRESCCSPFKLVTLNGATTCGIDGANSTTSTPTTKSASTPTPSTSTSSSPSAPTSTASPLSSTTVSYGNCCPDNGVWSSWKLVIPCTDSCGSCAKTVHERTCLSASSGCLCKGEYTKQTRCNTAPCEFPRDSCCDNLQPGSSNGSIVCGPEDAAEEDEPMTTTCVPYGGVWSDWGSWSTCTGAGCGGCGTANRTRTCGCTNLNCKCQGASSDSKPCKVVGVWSAWSKPTQCTDTCGGYGNMTRTRTCTTPDCPCSGNSTKVSDCAFKPCESPRQPCNCGCEVAKQNATMYYHLMSQNGVNVCAPYPMATTDDLPAEPEPCDDENACTTPSSQTISSTTLTSSSNSQPSTESSNTPASSSGPPSTTVAPVSTKKACPPGGKWSDWSNGTACTDSCGSCGTTTKSRTCDSQKDGCPCEGSATMQTSCNETPCQYPRDSCCKPFKAKNNPATSKIGCMA